MRLGLANFASFNALAAGSGSLSGINVQTGEINRLVQAFMSLCETRCALRYTSKRLGQSSIRLEVQTESGCVRSDLGCLRGAHLAVNLRGGNKDTLEGTLGCIDKSQGERPCHGWRCCTCSAGGGTI
jgi:hypothetical protein